MVTKSVIWIRVYAVRYVGLNFYTCLLPFVDNTWVICRLSLHRVILITTTYDLTLPLKNIVLRFEQTITERVILILIASSDGLRHLFIHFFIQVLSYLYVLSLPTLAIKICLVCCKSACLLLLFISLSTLFRGFL